jgi:arginine deiminase
MATSVPPPRSVSTGGVRSETGVLRRVLVHRPGRELDRLTPDNAAALLFDDAVDAERARQEHDALVATMAGAGVEVLRLGDLLAGAMRIGPARAGAIDRACAGLQGPDCERLAGWLSGLEAGDLAEVLIAGATFAEAEIGCDRLDRRGAGAAMPRFAVPPLPNQMFVRDSSAWLGLQSVLGATCNPVRAREAGIVESVYEHHPVFAAAGYRAPPIAGGRVEGGDLMHLTDGTVLVGVGSRTSCAGVERLADQLFRRGFRRVLAIEIPQRRSSIHLDCLMTLVDSDLLLADPRVLGSPVIELLPPGGRVGSRILPTLPVALTDALEVDRVRVVEVADAAEQWTLAANTVALAPGRVIAFAGNVRTNEALAAAGVDVRPVPGEELGRGRGGPRCLTCPLARDPGSVDSGRFPAGSQRS